MRILMILTIALALSACGSAAKKQYVEPDDEYAQQCLGACNATRLQCRTRAQDYNRQCREQYTFQQKQFNFCRQQGGKFCVRPERCPPAQTRVCTQQYDGCFMGCGGRIEGADEFPEQG